LNLPASHKNNKNNNKNQDAKSKNEGSRGDWRLAAGEATGKMLKLTGSEKKMDKEPRGGGC